MQKTSFNNKGGTTAARLTNKVKWKKNQKPAGRANLDGLQKFISKKIKPITIATKTPSFKTVGTVHIK